MDYSKLGKIIEDTFKQALDEPVYRFGLPGLTGGPIKKTNDGDTSNLRDTIKAIPTEYGIDLEMNVYGQWVQSGRMPGKYVPIKPLEEWITQKGLKFVNKKTNKPMTTKQMAFAISNHIHTFGIPSAPGWYDVAIQNLYNNKELDNILGDITVDELISKTQGI
jgi:hypothetical protein